MLILLIVLLLLATGGGFYGSTRRWGYAGWSPLGLILIICLLLYLTGNLRF
ncbi:MAG TPA: DUF3309 family protein [Myxococcales bacterium]|jgi:hypothetical protein